jgi:vancomycin resistance protein YoaR
MPIIERKNHAYRVHYYEWPYGPGVDATIYPPHPDLQFKNDTGHYVLIQTDMNMGTRVMTYSFYGTKNGREGKITKPVVLWSKSDGSLATTFNRLIYINGILTETNTFKSVYKSPSLYPTTR